MYGLFITSLRCRETLIILFSSVIEKLYIILCITELPVVAGASGASTVGAVVGVLLAAALLTAAVIVTAIVSYTMYIKKSKL